MQNEYIIPQEIKSEIYFGRGIFFLDLAIIAGYWFVMSNFETVVYEPLQMPYTIFNIALAFVMTRKSAKNPDRRIYQALLFTYLADQDTIYHGIERKQGGIDLEEDYKNSGY